MTAARKVFKLRTSSTYGIVLPRACREGGTCAFAWMLVRENYAEPVCQRCLRSMFEEERNTP